MIQLFNRDCMEAMAEMPDKAYDLAIVDPPYGIGESKANFESRSRSCEKWKNPTPKIYTSKDWDNQKPDEEYFVELMRVSKNQIIWGGQYFSLPLHSGWIFWDKLTGDNDFSDGELAYTSFDKAVRKFTHLWSGFKKAYPEVRIHPTQKPIQLYEWILKNYAKPGDKILDTHLGSGSIAIACYNLDFDLTGYEIDKEYYEAAVARLEEHKKQIRLFD